MLGLAGYSRLGAAKDLAGGAVAGVGEAMRMTGTAGRRLLNDIPSSRDEGFSFRSSFDLREPPALETMGQGLIENAPTSGQEGFIPGAVRGTGYSLAFLAGAAPAAIAGGPVSGTLAIAYLGAVTNGGQAYYEKLASDPEHPEKAWDAFVANGLVGGLTEPLPLGRILNRINKTTGGSLLKTMLREMGTESLEEFFQEGGQALASDIIARHLSDDEVPYFEALAQTLQDPESLKKAGEAGAMGAASVVPISGGATFAQAVLHSRSAQEAAGEIQGPEGGAGTEEAKGPLQPVSGPESVASKTAQVPEGFDPAGFQAQVAGGAEARAGGEAGTSAEVPPASTGVPEASAPSSGSEEAGPAPETATTPEIAPESTTTTAPETGGPARLATTEEETLFGTEQVPVEGTPRAHGEHIQATQGSLIDNEGTPGQTSLVDIEGARREQERQARLAKTQKKASKEGMERSARAKKAAAKRKKAHETGSLVNFVRSIGGLSGTAEGLEGEVAGLGEMPEGKSKIPGLANLAQTEPGKGTTIEKAAEAAVAAGFFPDVAPGEQVSTRDFIDALSSGLVHPEEAGRQAEAGQAEYENQQQAQLESAAEEAGMTPEEFLEQMAAPDPGVEFSFAGPPPIVGLELGNLLRGTWGSAKAIGKRFLTASGNLPQSAFEARIRRDAKVRAANQDVRFSAMDFRAAASQVYGRGGMKPQQMAAIGMALRNDKLVDSLPEPMRGPVRKLRRHVDALSRTMVSEGVVEGELAARILTPNEGKGTGLGVYLTRSYRVFDDPNWAKEGPGGDLVTKATPEIIARAKSLLRREYKGRSEDDIEGLLRTLLFVGREADSPIALLKRGKLGHKDLSILRGRKDIAPEIRALWGEYEDPLVNYARSVTKMSHLIANHQFLEEVAAAGAEEGWMLPPGDGPKGRLAVQIASEASQVMEPLNGYWTSPEIKKAFEDAEGAAAVHGALFRLYMKLLAATKVSKTVLSHVTHLRNVTGNVGFVVANAHWRLGKVSGAFRSVLTDTGIVKSDEWRVAYRRALELGVIHESANANELRDMIQDSVQFDVAEAIEEHGKLNLKVLAKRGLNVAMHLYRIEDDFWKLYGFENEKARYRKAQPSWSEEQVEAHAAKLTRNLYPTYSQVPEAVKLLRRNPLVGTFVSFPWEVFRTSKNTVVTIKEELSSDNAEVRKIGAQRLVGAITAATVTASLAAATRFFLGIDREDDENAREFMPPWSRNSDILWVGQSEDGSWNYVDAGYTDPYSYIKGPLKAYLRGEDWGSGVADAVSEALEPFVGTEILTGTLADLRERMKSDAFAALPLRDQSEEVFERLSKAFEPGSVTQLRRMRKAFTGEVERYGKAYDPKVEVFNSLTGIRINTLDVQQSLSFLAFEYQSALQGGQKIVSREASRRGEVSESDLRDAYEATEAARRRAFEGMRKVVSAASALGESEEDIRNTLLGSLSRKETNYILGGTYYPYSPSRGFLSYYMKNADDRRRDELDKRASAVMGFSKEAQEAAERRNQ